VHAHLTDGRSPAGGEDPLVSAPTGRSRKPSQHISKRQATNLIAYIHDKAILIQPAYRPLGKLLYNLKGVVPRDAKEFGIRATYQGILSGKRAGFTQNLGPGARRKAPTREVAPPSSRTSEKALSIWTIGAKYEPITCCEQTPASKFNSWDTHEAAPARDRQNGTDARNIEWLEPPDEVVAAAIKLYKSDTRGRWMAHMPGQSAMRM
jgi:hypothetical protein